MIRLLAPAILGLSTLMLASAPAQAGESAEQRLDRCLLTGASSVSQTNLGGAITEVRAFCGAQLRRVRGERVAEARRGLSGAAADTAEQQAIRQLDTEVAVTVSRLTGLNP
jgi:hypothetical protein